MPTLIELAQTIGLEHSFTMLASLTNIDIPCVIAAAAVLAGEMLITMLFGQWMFTSTGAAFHDLAHLERPCLINTGRYPDHP